MLLRCGQRRRLFEQQPACSGMSQPELRPRRCLTRLELRSGGASIQEQLPQPLTGSQASSDHTSRIVQLQGRGCARGVGGEGREVEVAAQRIDLHPQQQVQQGQRPSGRRRQRKGRLSNWCRNGCGGALLIVVAARSV